MNKKTIIVIAGLLALLCAVLLGIYFTTKSAQEQLEAPGEFTFTDDNEAQITLRTKDPRVVSLVSSYTEIWLDGGGKLVGVTNDAIAERDFGLTEQTCQPVGTTHEPNLELILSLQPDLVLLNPAQESHVSAQPILEQAGIACAYFEVEELEDYLRVLRIVTDLYETPQRYEEKGLAAQKLAEQIPVLFEYNQLVFCQKTPEIHNMVLPIICKQPLADKCNPYAFSGITLNNCCNRKFNLSPF